MKNLLPLIIMSALVLAAGCGTKKPSQTVQEAMFTGAPGEVKLITLDPGHFHAALIQNSMYDQVDSIVSVYAPEGQDVADHLARINGFNKRAANPTLWVEKVHTGSDFLEKMVADKPGNVVVISGNNAKKTDYILKSVEAGLNVLADKPMVTTPEAFPLLEQAFAVAAQKKVLLYDIMTERYEITTMLQRELAGMAAVFGTLQVGTIEEPAITKESVHHFSKIVSGSPLKRPAWFFDTDQQGEGIVDVTTHLVDLVQWEAFPEEPLKKEDVELLTAKRWATILTPIMFKQVTQLEQFPSYLLKNIKDNKLDVFSNGEINYKLKGIHAKVSVVWNFEAPAGAGDTHYSIMRGSKCNLIIKQGAEENYKPTLFIEPAHSEDIALFYDALSKAINEDIAAMFPGLKLVKVSNNLFSVEIPDRYKVGHEAHFAQVTAKYLRFLIFGSLPAWEVPNMIVKYYTTTEALKMARQVP